jgi:predicted RNA binding protein YcfA (HicA-like mRNA interferase family)
MSKLSPVSRTYLIKRLLILGFDGPFMGGKHPFMIKNDVRLTIPNEHKGEISVDLLSRIWKQAGINHETWLKK